MGKITDAIATAIRQSKQSQGAIARGSGVAPSQLSRLMSGERGLNTETVERLADYLGLHIIIMPKDKTTKGK